MLGVVLGEAMRLETVKFEDELVEDGLVEVCRLFVERRLGLGSGS